MNAAFSRFRDYLKPHPERRRSQAEFFHFLMEQTRVLLRPIGIVGIVSWIGMILDTDPKLHPEFPELLYFRLAFPIGGAVMVMAMSIKGLVNTDRKVMVLGYLLFVVSVLNTAIFTGILADDQAYVAGLQILILALVFFPVTLKITYSCLLLTIAAFVSAALLSSPNLSGPAARYSLNNLAITYVLAFVFAFIWDRFRFNLFIAQVRLRGVNAELEHRNEAMAAMNIELTAVRDSLWGEMQMAKKIQTILLPRKPAILGYEIATYTEPADEVGGDYYDIINLEGIDWLVIGDVSGHGVSAGLIMMMAQTAIRTSLAQSPGLLPAELMVVINRVLCDNIALMEEEKYMTITVMAAHHEGRFAFSGLHQDIMIYRAASRRVEIVETDGMWLGVCPDIGTMVDDRYLTMAAGDVMMLYTDGITEAWQRDSKPDQRDPDCDMFGQDRLALILAEWGDRGPAVVRTHILTALQDYIKSDDVTMVILQRN